MIIFAKFRLRPLHFFWLMWIITFPCKAAKKDEVMPLMHHDIYFVALLNRLPFSKKKLTAVQKNKPLYLLKKIEENDFLEKEYGLPAYDIRRILAAFLKDRKSGVSLDNMDTTIKQEKYQIEDKSPIIYVQDDWLSIVSSYNAEQYVHYITMTWRTPSATGIAPKTLAFLIVPTTYAARDQYMRYAESNTKESQAVYGSYGKQHNKELALIKVLDKMLHRLNGDGPFVKHTSNEYFFATYTQDASRQVTQKNEIGDHVIAFESNDMIHKVYKTTASNVVKLEEKYTVRLKNDLNAVAPLISFFVVEGDNIKTFTKVNIFFEKNAHQYPSHSAILNLLDYWTSFSKKRLFFDATLNEHTPFGRYYNREAAIYQGKDLMQYDDHGFEHEQQTGSSFAVAAHFNIRDLADEKVQKKNYTYWPWYLTFREEYKALLQFFTITLNNKKIDILGVPTILLDQKFFFQKRESQQDAWQKCNAQENIYYGLILCDSFLRAGKNGDNQHNAQYYQAPFHEEGTIQVVLKDKKAPQFTHLVNKKITKQEVQLIDPSQLAQVNNQLLPTLPSTSNTHTIPQNNAQVIQGNNGLGTTSAIAIGVVGIGGSVGRVLYYWGKSKRKGYKRAS